MVKFTSENSIIIYDRGWSTYENHNSLVIYEMMNGDIYVVHDWSNPYDGHKTEINKVTIDEACSVMYEYDEECNELEDIT